MTSAHREVRVKPGLVLPVGALEIRFSRSGGPGGQHVNKVETRAEVRFDLRGSPLLEEPDRRRALDRLASRLTNDGVLIVTCERTRHRERNLREALSKMGEILREAITPPKPRRRTRPTRGSKERRLESKRIHSARKRERSRGAEE